VAGGEIRAFEAREIGHDPSQRLRNRRAVGGGRRRERESQEDGGEQGEDQGSHGNPPWWPYPSSGYRAGLLGQVEQAEEGDRPVARRDSTACVGGFLTFDQSVFTHMQGMGTPVEVPTPMFLVEHRDGRVLFETGLHPALRRRPCRSLGRS